MKKFWTLFLVLWGFNAAAQKVEFWSGVLQTGVMDLPITLELRFSKDTVTFMGSPSQTEEVFKAEKVRLKNDSLLLSMSSMGAKVVFRGGFNEAGDSVCGIFSQGDAKSAAGTKSFRLGGLTFEKINPEIQFHWASGWIFMLF